MEYLKYILGLLYKKRAFIGPHSVSIYLTNRCNQDCIYCPTHSPYRQNMINQDIKIYENNIEDIKKLLDSLGIYGTKQIILSGGGEPFLYPHIFEVIKYIKEKNMRCFVITNGTVLTKDGMKRIIELQVDKLFVSVGSEDESIYFKIHSSRSNLEKIKTFLKYLKEDRKEKKPYIGIFNVICKENIGKFEQMIKFAEEYADEIRFSMMFAYKGLENLIPSQKQILGFLEKTKYLKKSAKIKIKNNLKNFTQNLVYEIFLREKLNKWIHEDMPCYVGWFHSIVNAFGNVIPCCGKERMDMGLGNVKYRDFSRIWTSDKYNQFREEALKTKKSKEWKETYCSYSCMYSEYNDLVNRMLHTIKYIRRNIKYILFTKKLLKNNGIK